MAIPLGALEFVTVTYNHQDLAAALNAFVTAGSVRGQIAITDLSIVSRHANNLEPFTTVADAISRGTRLFDALAYFSLHPDLRPDIVHEELGEDEEDPAVDDIGRSLFYVFMFILIRGSAPSHIATNNTTPVPRFLSNVMNLTETPDVYADRLASFDIQLMHHGWVRHITLDGLDHTVQNRLALGVAGYRLPAALCIAELKQDLAPELVTAVEAVRNFVNRGMVWDCVGHVRSARFLDAVKNMNKNVGNLISLSVPDDVIARLVRLRVLFEAPVYDERFTQYLTWTNATFAEFDDFIFPQA